MGNLLSSGDVGFCKREGHTSAMTLTWDDNTVVEVDCQYKTCGYATQCEMYQRHPVGFQKVYPLSQKSE